MQICFSDMQTIKNAMGKNYDLLQVVDNELHLHWWTNKGAKHEVVKDFNPHVSYSFPFFKKVLEDTISFDVFFDEGFKKDSEEFKHLLKVYL